MRSRLLLPLALAAIASIGAATPAAACCACALPCAPPVVVVAPPVVIVTPPAYVKPFYVVDQGPVYGGPHIVTTPRIEYFHVRPAHYPRVRESYYYPTYRDSYSVAP
jgi:hypothetical protein